MLVRKLQAAAGNAGGEALYVEDVFSTYLYTGTGSNHTITNGINFSGEGGLLWIKNRTSGSAAYPAANNVLINTERGGGKLSYSNVGGSELDFTGTYGVTFNSDGFTLLSEYTGYNTSGESIVSWSFRKASKFFDVVTYTGNGTAGRTVAHNLGSVPGCIIVKSTGSNNWQVYHSGLTSSAYNLILNDTSAQSSTLNEWNSTAPTSTQFTVGSSGNVNNSGTVYVAYLFASDAGGFGEDGSESIIKCGSFTYPVSGAVEVDLGFEPQWVLLKRVDGTSNWWIVDTQRGWASQKTSGTFSGSTAGHLGALWADNTNADSGYDYGGLTTTGFKWASNFNAGTGNTKYIYVAIRRPMKTPESGTEVFTPLKVVSSTLGDTRTMGFPADLIIGGRYDSADTASNWFWIDKMRGMLSKYDNASSTDGYGAQRKIVSSGTAAEVTNSSPSNPYLYAFNDMTSCKQGYGAGYIGNGGNLIYYFLKRAPGFFDIVCYQGTGVAGLQIPHNLTVAPEMMVVKHRNGVDNWEVYHQALGNTTGLILNSNIATQTDSTFWNNTSPTSAVFTLGTNGRVNINAETFVAYLFATLAGISKVGNYTGTGTTLNIDCGFSAGARFILIKRTDSTGGWYVWDSARGITSGNDPWIHLNSYGAENASTDYVAPLSSGFTITSSAPSFINASGGTFIYLAIA